MRAFPITATFFLMTFLSSLLSGPLPAATVRVRRVPQGGIQPQVVVDSRGTVHLLYLRGAPKACDIFYSTSKDNGRTFSEPIRVNSQPESAVAIGTIRGPQLAFGRNDRVHVAWNGSRWAKPFGKLDRETGRRSPPMLYTRLSADGQSFEPQRNLMKTTFGLDGGGSLAADTKGNVYVIWHARTRGAPKGEAGRRVYLAVSHDDGKTFSTERPISDPAEGACGCCSLRSFCDSQGTLYTLYRGARDSIFRDMFLLRSGKNDNEFRSTGIDKWQVAQCVMSSASMFQTGNTVLCAWETEEQVYFGAVDTATGRLAGRKGAPGFGLKRKHPVVSANAKGETLLVWTGGTGWNRGGAIAWQVYGKNGKATSERGRKNGLPKWSLAAAFPDSDGGFTILY